MTTGTSFDPGAMRERYRTEREKPLRPDGHDQSIEVTGAFARDLDAPDVAEPLERAPLTDRST